MDDLIKEILKKYRKIATVGFSRNPSKPARKVPKFLISKGYDVIPVNPNVDEILRRKSYENILEIPEEIEIVQIFRPSEEVPKIVEDAIKRGDVKVIWMQEGIKNEEAKRRGEERGLTVVENKCMYKEYVRLIEGREPEEL